MTDKQPAAELRAAITAATSAIGRAIDALDDADTSLAEVWRLMGAGKARSGQAGTIGLDCTTVTITENQAHQDIERMRQAFAGYTDRMPLDLAERLHGTESSMDDRRRSDLAGALFADSADACDHEWSHNRR